MKSVFSCKSIPAEIQKKIDLRRRARHRLALALARRGIGISAKEAARYGAIYLHEQGGKSQVFLTYDGLRRIWIDKVRGMKDQKGG